MKLIIAGSRSFHDVERLFSFMTAWVSDHGLPEEVLSGGADGADQLGETWAKARAIPVTKHKPDYAKYGPKAPLVRNIDMACDADALVAFWDGESHGTAHMMQQARGHGLDVTVVMVGEETA